MMHSLGKANSVLVKIVHCVKLAQEHIAHDPQWSHGFRQVHAHERRNTGTLHVKYVVSSLQRVRLVVKIKC